ncbi:zf-HC2 domain-containing protein [Neobacillus sp. SM06]|uniref:zf-HC2 domain-containing protein n=1 Tax=Neobacillus sp. SM06 TaxID=3422492 RepID=UPI003D26E3D6
MKCPEEIVQLMHEYLDGDIAQDNEAILREHLQGCKECEQFFNELKRTIALIKGTTSLHVAEDFTDRLLAKLPKEKRTIGIQRWLRNHPFIAAASLFLVLMMGSFVSSWNQDREFSVSKQKNLIVENNTVIVPKGEIVKGDVVVRNGKLKIEGEVDGNVTLIHGEKYMASAGKVTGEIKEVNEVFDWIWYYLKQTGKNILQVFEGKQNNAP